MRQDGTDVPVGETENAFDEILLCLFDLAVFETFLNDRLDVFFCGLDRDLFAETEKSGDPVGDEGKGDRDGGKQSRITVDGSCDRHCHFFRIRERDPLRNEPAEDHDEEDGDRDRDQDQDDENERNLLERRDRPRFDKIPDESGCFRIKGKGAEESQEKEKEISRHADRDQEPARFRDHIQRFFGIRVAGSRRRLQMRAAHRIQRRFRNREKTAEKDGNEKNGKKDQRSWNRHESHIIRSLFMNISIRPEKNHRRGSQKRITEEDHRRGSQKRITEKEHRKGTQKRITEENHRKGSQKRITEKEHRKGTQKRIAEQHGITEKRAAGKK